MKDIPEALKERQRETRKKTMAEVNKAINELSSEGYLISMKHLVERTGLSRSVFRKKHVMEILKERKIGMYAVRKTICDNTNQSAVQFKNIQKQLEKSNNKIYKLQSELCSKQLQIISLQKAVSEKNDECELLRGDIFMLYKKATVKGIDLQKS